MIASPVGAYYKGGLTPITLWMVEESRLTRSVRTIKSLHV